MAGEPKRKPVLLLLSISRKMDVLCSFVSRGCGELGRNPETLASRIGSFGSVLAVRWRNHALDGRQHTEHTRLRHPGRYTALRRLRFERRTGDVRAITSLGIALGYIVRPDCDFGDGQPKSCQRGSGLGGSESIAFLHTAARGDRHDAQI